MVISLLNSIVPYKTRLNRYKPAGGLLVALGCLMISNSQAANTLTLPQGRHKLGVIYARTGEIREAFGADGERVSLVAPYQLELSSRNFSRAEPRVSELVNFLNNLGYRYDVDGRETDNGIRDGSTDDSLPLLGDALSRGSLGVDAWAEREQWVFMLQRGFTERLSAGLALPVIHQSFRIRSQIGGVNTANDIYQYFTGVGGGALQDFNDALGLLAQINSSTFQNVLASKGYQPLEDSDESGIGDLIIGGRYRWKELDLATGSRLAGRWLGALEGRVTLPTGRLASPDELAGLDFGTGAVSFMVGHNSSYRVEGKDTPKLLRRLALFHNISTQRNLPYQRTRRVRTSPGDFLPDESTKQPVTIALGSSWLQNFGVDYTINPTLTFSAQFDWLIRNSDLLLTAEPDTSRADYLATGTAGNLRSLQLKLNASSIGSFLRGGMPLPGELSVTWNQPLAGRNQILTPYVLGELALYF